MDGIYERLLKLSQKQLVSLVLELQKKAEGKEVEKEEDIAVIGLGCRFPGDASSPKKYWELLCNGVDAVDTVSKERWNPEEYDFYCNAGGFLKCAEIETFDPAFFGISATEAKQMSPSQRLLLEVSWEALEYAGIAPANLSGSKTGVFFGVSNNDYSSQQAIEEQDAYHAIGNSFSAMAGRVSYFLGLEGPSIAVDTACSSSLVAVHQACESLKKKECNMAITGGVNVIVTPESYRSLSLSKMLSPDGKCKTFDADANGYVRGEGCGIVILKRLSDAVREGDEILAVIKGSAVNHNGKSGGLTVPKGSAQVEVIQKALKQAGIAPEQVGYIEAHGTGTSLGDLIELQALGNVFQHNHSKENPLWIGSVKTNIGHLEGAAGIAGFIKAVLSIYHKQIPAHLNLQKMNVHIRLDDINSAIPQKQMDWPSAYQKKIAGVSSFGFSGTNAHVILQEAPQKQEIEKKEKPCYVFTLSGRTKSALHEYVQNVIQYSREYVEASVPSICLEGNQRAKFNHRIACCARNKEEMLDALSHFVVERCAEGVYHNRTESDVHPKIAFVYTEHVSDYAKKAKEFYQYCPTFRKALQQCEAWIQKEAYWSLLELIFNGATEADETKKEIISFCLQYALLEQWKAYHVKPYSVYAEGVGEVAAACGLGYLRLQDALQMILSDKEEMEWRSNYHNCDTVVTDTNMFSKQGIHEIIQLGELELFSHIKTFNMWEKEEAYQRWMEELCELYCMGIDIAWNDTQDKSAGRLLDYPTYPFQRESYWIGSAYNNRLQRKDSVWEDIEELATTESAAISEHFDMTQLEKENEYLDELAMNYMVKAFEDMQAWKNGFQSKTEMMKQCGILPRYEQLMDAWLAHLVKHGRLEKQGDTYGNLKSEWVINDVSLAEYPELKYSIGIIKECGVHLEEVLTGKIEPQSVLFKDGSFDLLEGIYKDDVRAVYNNGLVKKLCKVVCNVSKNKIKEEKIGKQKKLRILEIGAGTGSLTEVLLPALSEVEVEYVFTDISNSFLKKAQEKYRAYTNVTYKRFDVEKEITKQGFQKESFDLVLASNVLHATKNLKDSLQNVYDLLVSQGLVMLIELNKSTAFFDMTFGLVHEQIEDQEIRGRHIFLSSEGWQQVLTQQGFSDVLTLPDNMDNSLIFGQNVIVSRKEYVKTQATCEVEAPVSVAEKKEQVILKEEKSKLDAEFLERYYKTSMEERVDLLKEYLKIQLNTLLEYSDYETIEEGVSLVELGVDSLMIIDYRVLLEGKLGVSLAVGAFYDNATISSLASYYVKEMKMNVQEINSVEQYIALNLKAKPEERFIPFPFSPIQKAYVTKYDYDGTYLLTGGFYEYECESLDMVRFDKAINKLIEQHDMMRVVILDENRQVVLEDIPEYETEVEDLRGKTEKEVAEILEEGRDRRNYALCQAEMWPAFDIKVYQQENNITIQLFLPGFIMDAVGVGILLDGIKKYYENSDMQIEPIPLSFRDYLMDMKQLETKEPMEESRRYWKKQIEILPKGIQLPMVKEKVSIEDYQYNTRFGSLDAEQWANCKKAASKMGLTPSGLLCACLCKVLQKWSGMDAFTINAMAYNRSIPHDDIRKIMGNMSSTILIGANNMVEDFEEYAKDIQKQILEGVDHRYISSVQMLRELSNQTVVEEEPYLLPVMFDSLFGVYTEPTSEQWLGKAIHQRIERHPELLDCQVMENEKQELIIKWDTADVLLSEQVVEEMFANYLCEINQVVQ